MRARRKPTYDLDMGRNASRLCIYCGAEGTTRDHVVPRCLLEPKYPDNLPTVPCCKPCNEERSLDEQYFGIALAQVGFHSLLQEKLAPGGIVDRALERRPTLDDRIISSLNVGADGRVYFAPEMDRMEKVALKIAFGLYCRRYELGRVPEMEISDRFRWRIQRRPGTTSSSWLTTSGSCRGAGRTCKRECSRTCSFATGCGRTSASSRAS